MIYKKQNFGGYNLHTIKTDKFKLCHIEIIFRNKVVKEDITKRKVLFDVLCETSKNYPHHRDLILKLEDLYNANVYTVTSKVGASIITNFCMDIINPIYSDFSMLDESFKFLFELLLNPNVTNNEFDDKTVNLVKSKIEQDIKTVKENPKKYALLKALETIKNSPTSYATIGYLEDLNNITSENLYNYYLDLLQSDCIDIYVAGNLDMDKVSETISKYAKFKIIKTKQIPMYVNNYRLKEKVYSEKLVNCQSTIAILVNVNSLDSYDTKYLANIYNVILGGGSLESKLYKKLRNENSLCYNVGSIYHKYDNMFFILTSVDVNASDKAIKLIKETIKEMTYSITDKELEESKKMIESSITMSLDSIGKIVDVKFYQDVSDLDDTETRIETFRKITKEEIYKFAKKVSVGTIFKLEGKENE